MRTRTTLLLLGVLLVLGALAALSRRPGTGEPGAAGAPVFPGLEAAAVRSVRVERPEGAVGLERGDRGWTVTPGGHPADGEAVERLLGQIAGLAGGSVVSTNPAKRGAYGLEEGRRIGVRLEGAGGAALAEFAVGASGPDFAGAHLARAGDDRVLLVPLDLRVPLGRAAAAWRDRRAVGLAAGEIAAVRIGRDGATVSLERDADGGWRVDGAPADGAAAERYVGQLAALRVASFGEAGDEAAAGLDAPAATVEAGAGERSVTLVVGALREADGQRFLRSSRFDAPLLVPAHAAEALLKTAADFRPPPGPPGEQR